MTLDDFKAVRKILAIYVVKVIVAGIIIGSLYTQEVLLFVLLGLRIAYRIYTLTKEEEKGVPLLVFGMLLTGIIGVVIEYFGTKHLYWEYHDIDRQLPLYLFFVWMLAFTFIYRLERKVFSKMKGLTNKNRWILSFLILLIYPTIGEMVTINLGVWTYYVSYKFWGVSHVTILSIAVVHAIISSFQAYIFKKASVKNVVFNP